MNHGPASQLKTIVTLFVVLRVTIVLLYTPQGLLNAYTDYQHYYRTAQLTDDGYYPFVNMWYEYPPVTTYLSIGVYRLTRAVLPTGDLDSVTYQVYARLLASVFLVFETGVLIALYRLAARAYNVSRANWLGWVYACLSVPLFFWNASQNSVVVWCALLSVYWLIEGRHTRSAVTLGLGIAAKFTPVFLIAPALKVLWPDRRGAIRYAALAGVTVAAIYAPFVLLGGGAWIAASFVMLARLASYSTPWALIDGNWLPGDAGPLSNRVELAAIDQLPGHPAVISGAIVIAAFAIGYWLIARRPIDRARPTAIIGFATFTALIFLLWSKGWSPQWATLIIPFILLTWPTERGLRWVLLLTAIVFIEWPLADALRSQALLALAIVARTALWIGLAKKTSEVLRSTPEV
jgi:hypothetical protein